MSGPTEAPSLPPKFADLKQEIANSYPDFEERVTKAWKEILGELEGVAKVIEQEGSNYIPQVNFKDLDGLSQSEIGKIRKVGSVVIKDIVDDADAVAWKEFLKEFVKTNPNVEGDPIDDKQFFQLYWTKAQVQARSHANVLAATAWLNNLYHMKDGSEYKLEGVNLSVPLTYADRFRIRHPGNQWTVHPPHVDGGSIERWEDTNFRKCFADILEGNWRKHDPYDLEGRLNARSSLYGRPNQSSVFRSFQGWLALSEIAPTQGTLKVFPDVVLSNAYLILRPFFRPLVTPDSADIYDPKQWAFELSGSKFPGIYPRDGGFAGPRPTPLLHPNMRLEKNMTSMPKVNPGDAVFWHCDVVHSVEVEHTGVGDSAVMYIPAVPCTPQNLAYVERQRECFLRGERPPDFPKGDAENAYVGIGGVDDILTPVGRIAMAIPVAATA